MTTRTGIRGGHVRSVEEARGLQEHFKAEISAKVRRSIVSTLLEKSQWHADDSAHLEIPAEHLNCVGAQVSGLVRRGYMVEVGRRRAASAASNGRKSGIFAITDLGRRKLVGVSGDTFPEGSAGRPSVTADSGESVGSSGADLGLTARTTLGLRGESRVRTAASGAAPSAEPDRCSLANGPVEGPPDYEIAYGPLCPGEGWGLVWVLGSLKQTEPAAYWRRPVQQQRLAA